MGRLNPAQGQLFYSFCLSDAVPNDHPIREIAAVLDLKWGYSELAPHYPPIGRPSVVADAAHRLPICDPLGARAVPGGQGQPRLGATVFCGAVASRIRT